MSDESLDERVARLRSTVDERLAAGDGLGARATLEELWRTRPGSSLATFVLGRFAKLPPELHRRRATVSIHRSFTVEPIVPVLRAAAAASGIDLTVHLGDFNTYQQELLDPSSALYGDEWRPDVALVLVQTRDIAPELWDRFHELGDDPEAVARVVDRVVGEFRAMVAAFRRSSTADLLLHTLDQPWHLSLGLGDRTSPAGQVAAVVEINRRLAELADGTTGVHLVDYDGVIAAAGRSSWYDDRKWVAMRLPVRSDHFATLAQAWMRHLQPLIGLVAKALVVDLDNTLWGGVAGEDGMTGIRLGPDAVGAGYVALQRTLAGIRRRGVLLAICSKNNAADAIEILDGHPEMVLRSDAFAVVRTNWDDKAENIRSIAAELNIGLDAIAFLDDNPAECELVRRRLPEVFVLELDRPPTASWNPVLDHPLFERLRLSDEDRRRNRFYAEQQARAVSLEQAGSLEDHLRSLGTVVTVSHTVADEIARVAQLTQKTNQLNVTTRRYTEQEIESLVASDDAIVWSVRASDRFGDHGLVGVMIVRAEGAAWQLDSLLLSCRVIGRGVEIAMAASVVSEASTAGVGQVDGTFIPTAKNAPARSLFESAGFALADESDQQTRWTRRTAAGPLQVPDWITHVHGASYQGPPITRTPGSPA